jgi:hypothetical protein
MGRGQRALEFVRRHSGANQILNDVEYRYSGGELIRQWLLVALTGAVQLDTPAFPVYKACYLGPDTRWP